MTPTEQDNELRAEVKQVLKDGFDYYILERKDTSSDMKPLDTYCTEHLMQLITTDRKRVALEARIDTIDNMLNSNPGILHDCGKRLDGVFGKTYLEYKKSELKAQQEEV